MKFNYLLILVMALILSSCEAPVEEVAKEGEQTDRIVNTVCDENSAGCDMNWIVTYKYVNFPKTIQILVNNKVIWTECGDLKYSVARNQNTDSVEIYMWNYRRLSPKNKTKFSFEIKSVNCNDLSKTVTFDFNNPQAYTLDDDLTPTRAFLKN